MLQEINDIKARGSITDNPSMWFYYPFSFELHPIGYNYLIFNFFIPDRVYNSKLLYIYT
jgi:hypothetical protein